MALKYDSLESIKLFKKIKHFNQFSCLIDHHYKFVTFKKIGSRFKNFLESFVSVAFVMRFQLLKHTNFFIQNLKVDDRGLRENFTKNFFSQFNRKNCELAEFKFFRFPTNCYLETFSYHKRAYCTMPRFLVQKCIVRSHKAEILLQICVVTIAYFCSHLLDRMHCTWGAYPTCYL